MYPCLCGVLTGDRTKNTEQKRKIIIIKNYISLLKRIYVVKLFIAKIRIWYSKEKENMTTASETWSVTDLRYSVLNCPD